ncbi:hypothetical protein ABW20_dc0106297 [Dactylellina cionopaga]|nr:hypothetical protein ABW20_dc0106297 [Dactylellina cionopaga]
MIANIIASNELSQYYEILLPNIDDMFMVVIFKAKDAALNDILAEKINSTGRIWVSGTVWAGSKAVRVAAANWRVNLEEEGFGGVGVAREVLRQVAGLAS